MRIQFTSGYDFLIATLRLLIGIILGMFGLITVLKISNWFVLISGLESTIPEWVEGVIGLTSAIIGSVLGLYVYYKTAGPFLNNLSSFLYIRRDLKAKVTFNEAKLLSFLFVPNDSGKWYPLDHIPTLPEDQRKQQLFILAQQIINGK